MQIAIVALTGFLHIARLKKLLAKGNARRGISIVGTVGGLVAPVLFMYINK